MPNRVIPFALLALLALGLSGCVRSHCCRRPPPTVPCPTRSVAPTRAPTSADAVERAADETLARARAAEPETTALLQTFAADAQGRLEGLEHRLKSRKSTVSKYRRMMQKHPGTPPDEIPLYDALRYTIVIPEVAPGHHLRHVRGLFEHLEGVGHEVVVVKNYWPPGDTYSGVNATLRNAEGLLWELQCHTPASYATKSSTHDDYELMRDPKTSMEEQQRLFDKMTRMWDDIPIPQGMLEPKAVHPKEETRLSDRPAKAA